MSRECNEKGMGIQADRKEATSKERIEKQQREGGMKEMEE